MNRKPWSIWYASVRFEEDPNQVKIRPVIVIGQNVCFTISFKVTSNLKRHGYQIIRWREANLTKPSVAIIFDKPLELIERDFRQQIGDLHPEDIQGISDSLKHGRYRA